MSNQVKQIAVGLYHRAMSNQVNQISVGLYHTIGVMDDGTVQAIGFNQFGQCFVSDWKDIVQVAGGIFCSLGLNKNGKVFVRGLGFDVMDFKHWDAIVSIVVGSNHAVGLKSDGTVVATGSNMYGQCSVSGWKDIVQVAASLNNTLGLKSDGTVVAVGDDNLKQCSVSGWKDIVQVASGSECSIGLRSDGTVVATGWDIIKRDLVNWRGITSISGSELNVTGVIDDGTCLISGSNLFDVKAWNNINKLIAGERHIVGINNDGTVQAIGFNQFGQCNVSGWIFSHSNNISSIGMEL